ncbi:MAG: hypothetical protein ACKVHU_05200 [Acidimicrobiales bacterium]
MNVEAGFPGQFPELIAAIVNQPMMVMAEQRQVVQVGVSEVGPVSDVMCITFAGWG